MLGRINRRVDSAISGSFGPYQHLWLNRRIDRAFDSVSLIVSVCFVDSAMVLLADWSKRRANQRRYMHYPHDVVDKPLNRRVDTALIQNW